MHTVIKIYKNANLNLYVSIKCLLGVFVNRSWTYERMCVPRWYFGTKIYNFSEIVDELWKVIFNIDDS